jgi:hypothetical protein
MRCAVVAQIYGDDRHHAIVREKCMDYMARLRCPVEIPFSRSVN